MLFELGTCLRRNQVPLGADRKARDGATVTLTGSVNRKQTSDGTGFFGFADLPPDSYTVAVKQGDKTISTGKATVEAGKVAEVGVQ